MKRILNISVMLVTWINLNFAQIDCELSPELEQEISKVAASPLDFCFDVEWVQGNCIPVYINVNVHFILNDSCGGNVAVEDYVQGDLTPPNAFNLAETMINDANEFFEIMSENDQGQWNSAAHNTPETDPQCIPIRYVLSGVYLHCDSESQLVDYSFDESQFFVNPDNEVNIIVTVIDFYPNDPKDSPTGYASNLENFAVVENLSPGILNHELAHVFDVGHTFWPDDGCDDTWDYNWEWDSDCDGIPDVFNDKCWNSEPLYNDQDACDTNIFCEEHPCCEW